MIRTTCYTKTMFFCFKYLKSYLTTLIVISLCILLSKPILFANTLTIENKQLLINHKTVNLNSDIIYDNGIPYLPLRDITKHLQTKLSFNKFEYQHNWKLSDTTTVSFSRFQPKYTFNSQPIYWKHLLKYEFNRIYISLPDLKELLSKKPNQKIPTLLKKQTKTLPKLKTPAKTNKISPLFKTPNTKPESSKNTNTLLAGPLPLDELPLPKLTKNQPLYVTAQSKSIDASTKHRMYQGELWFNFESILKSIGYNIRRTQTGFIAQKGDKRYIFSTKSKYLKTAWMGTQWYSPMKKTALYLGFIPFWQHKTIHLLNFIKDIQITEHKTHNEIRIKSTHPLVYSKQTQIDAKQSYFDLKNSYFDSKTHIKKLNKGPLKSLILGKHPTFHRLVLNSRSLIKTQQNNEALVFRISNNIPTLSKESPLKPLTAVHKQKKTYKPFNRSQKRIAIDPGHGGYDPGAVPYANIYEKKYAWDISVKLKKHLEQKGYKVVMLRSWDKNPSLWQRVNKANLQQCDALISVHLNSFDQKSVYGSETYYYKYQDKALANAVHQQIISSTDTKNNGLKRAKMYVLHHAKMPSVLIEPAYMSHPQSLKKIKDPAFQTRLARAITKGLDHYFTSNLSSN